MSNQASSSDAEGFNSDRFLRRLERERKLKEMEQAFQNIAEEAKQKQEDIYSNVFTEQGQAEILATHNSDQVNNSPLNNPAQSNGQSMFSRMSAFAQNKPQNPPPTLFEMSPRGVASFPEIGPIGVAHKNERRPWQNDGPGLGSRVSNARVQDTIFKSFFSIRTNSKKLVLAILMFCFLVTLIVTLIDVNAKPVLEISEEAWKKLEIIRPKLVEQNVEERRLRDTESVHFESLVWLSREATEVPIPSSQELLERFVMVVFYYSTGGESWSNNGNWLKNGVSICSWHGVTCGHGTYKSVEKIMLRNNNLKGTITDEISKLQSLYELVLSRNELAGEVPSSLGDLIALRNLQLGENDLTGEMPLKICDLKDENLNVLVSDCGGQNKDIDCDCCTECAP